MRDPVLHIKQSKLQEILDDMLSGSQTVIDANNVLLLATERKYQLKDRYQVVVKNNKTRNKAARTITAENDITEKFNQILTSIIQQRQLKNIPLILKDSKEYTALKEAANFAFTYANDLDVVPREEGYKNFIEVGLHIMGKKFSVMKLKYYLPKIYDITECLQVIAKDNDREGTLAFREAWKKISALYTNSWFDSGNDEDYVHFVYGRQEADLAKAKYDDWIKSQFDQLAFLNVIPELNQLYGLNAQKRYRSFAAKQGIKKGGRVSDTKDTYSSAEESLYFQKLREKRAEK